MKTGKESGKLKYDKGYKGQSSGSSKSDYRGNNYNSLKDSVESSDKSKLNRQKCVKY